MDEDVYGTPECQVKQREYVQAPARRIMRGMIRQRPLPPDIATRLSDLGPALERCSTVVFAYLFGGAGRGDLKPLSDVVLNTAPTALVGRILGSRRVILDREPFRRHRFQSQVLREFLDSRVFEHQLLSRRYPGG
jgi:hypothetical protein